MIMKKKKKKDIASPVNNEDDTVEQAKTSPKKKKSFFKKLIRQLFLLLFLALAGFIFYKGWIQPDIPEGKYALIRTKKRNGDISLMQEGDFMWRWENLIPGNMSVHILDFPLRTLETSMEGELPSGKLYGDFINQPKAFLMEAKVKYSYRLIPEKALLKTPASSDVPFAELYAAYEGRARREILRYLEQNSSKAVENPGETEQAMMKLMENLDGCFKAESLELQKLNLPDKELYKEAKALYLKEMAETIRIKAEHKKENMKSLSDMELKMDILKEYGKVLSEYPVLLEYFELDKENLDPRILTENLPQKE